jgi:hypothetical protein
MCLSHADRRDDLTSALEEVTENLSGLHSDDKERAGRSAKQIEVHDFGAYSLSYGYSAQLWRKVAERNVDEVLVRIEVVDHVVIAQSVEMERAIEQIEFENIMATTTEKTVSTLATTIRSLPVPP